MLWAPSSAWFLGARISMGALSAYLVQAPSSTLNSVYATPETGSVATRVTTTAVRCQRSSTPLATVTGGSASPGDGLGETPGDEARDAATARGLRRADFDAGLHEQA